MYFNKGIIDGCLRRGAWEGVVGEKRLRIYNIVLTRQNDACINVYIDLHHRFVFYWEFSTGASGGVPGKV